MCYDKANRTPVISFNIGSTSTDVSHYTGSLDYVFKSKTTSIIV